MLYGAKLELTHINPLKWKGEPDPVKAINPLYSWPYTGCTIEEQGWMANSWQEVTGWGLTFQCAGNLTHSIPFPLMHRPVVGRTTSQSSWHQRWNDRLQSGETPCQYRAGNVEAALRHRREWVPEMAVSAELFSQAAWDAGSRDGQTPDLELVRLCLALETACRCQESRASCCCLVMGEGWTELLLNSTESHLKLNWLWSKWTHTSGKWLLLSESNFLKADPRHGTNSRLGEYLFPYSSEKLGLNLKGRLTLWSHPQFCLCLPHKLQGTDSFPPYFQLLVDPARSPGGSRFSQPNQAHTVTWVSGSWKGFCHAD